MLNNPFTFNTGTDRECFTTDGQGSIMFHFSPRDNGLSVSMKNNLTFFATDEDNALVILKNAFLFAIDCNIKYIGCNIENSIHKADFEEKRTEQNKEYKSYIEAIGLGKVKLTKCPTNQFYMVSWAANDVIH